MPTVTLRGVPLHYQDRGQGLPVLLLHAFPLSSEAFAPQLEALSRSFRIIAPDHRGFGRSAAPAEGSALEMSTLAQDALALLDHLGIERAVIGGISMGGYAAMAVLREDAGRVLGLILIDTQPGADDEAGKKTRAETAQAITERGVEVLVERMLPKLLAPNARPEVRQEVERLIRTASPQGAAAATRGMALRFDSKDVLARFAGPALVMVGAKDGITPPEKARALKELIPGAQLVELADAGHLSNLEAPQPFNDALEAFLRRIEGP